MLVLVNFSGSLLRLSGLVRALLLSIVVLVLGCCTVIVMSLRCGALVSVLVCSIRVFATFRWYV